MIKLEKERRDKTTDLAGIAFSRNRDSRVTEKIPRFDWTDMKGDADYVTVPITYTHIGRKFHMQIFA